MSYGFFLYCSAAYIRFVYLLCKVQLFCHLSRTNMDPHGANKSLAITVRDLLVFQGYRSQINQDFRVHYTFTMSDVASNVARVFSLAGRGLRLDSEADIEPHLKQLDANVTEEIHLHGNTIGIEASRALGKVLSELKVLKVSFFFPLLVGRTS